MFELKLSGIQNLLFLNLKSIKERGSIMINIQKVVASILVSAGGFLLLLVSYVVDIIPFILEIYRLVPFLTLSYSRCLFFIYN